MADDEGLLRRIEILEAINEIKDLKAQYWRMLDRKRPEEVRKCFIPEARIDMQGVPPCADRDAFVTVIQASGCRPEYYNMHHGQNPRIILTGPDSAEGVWDSYFHSVDVAARRIIQLAGEYHDGYVRQEGRWLIASMQFRQTSFLMEEVESDGTIKAIVLSPEAAPDFG